VGAHAKAAPRPGDDEEDDWDEVVEFTASDGHFDVAAGGLEVMGDGLLQLYAEIVKLAVVLREAEPEEFRVLVPRLRLLKDAVAALPLEPRPRHMVGFRPPTPKTKRSKIARRRSK
jgi:hypothetical protein